MAGGSQPTRRRVTFYTKPGCHLCEHAEEALEELQGDFDLHITPVDITADLAVFERYKYEIPVIVVDGGGTISGRIDSAAIRGALDSAITD